MITIKIQNSLRNLLILSIALTSLLTIFSPKVFADTVICNDGSEHTLIGSDYACLGPGENGVKTVIQDDADTAKKTIENDCDTAQPTADDCGIIRYLVDFINLLSALVGIVVVGSLIVAGIQYSSAGGDPQKVGAAKDRIRNTIIALAFFIFTYAILNYLVPGGVL